MKIEFENIRFDEKGLVPVIVQDWISSKVLMMAYSNREALELLESTGYMHFFSRSRQKLWQKGETSGNTLKIKELVLDCDGDTLLARVEPSGPACHTGAESCFFRTLFGSQTPSLTFLADLQKYLQIRKEDDPHESYTARLHEKGIMEISKKIGEEGVESALALVSGNRKDSIYEIADLFYHTLVGMMTLDIGLKDIVDELSERHSVNS